MTKVNFDRLVTEFRQAIEAEAALGGRRRLIMSAAVAADPERIGQGYEVGNLCAQMDYVSVMTYDYHGGGWDRWTGLNSPLYGRRAEAYVRGGRRAPAIAAWKNVNYSVNYWVANGCPHHKINLGLAAYGNLFLEVDVRGR